MTDKPKYRAVGCQMLDSDGFTVCICTHGFKIPEMASQESLTTSDTEARPFQDGNRLAERIARLLNAEEENHD